MMDNAVDPMILTLITTNSKPCKKKDPKRIELTQSRVFQCLIVRKGHIGTRETRKGREEMNGIYFDRPRIRIKKLVV